MTDELIKEALRLKDEKRALASSAHGSYAQKCEMEADFLQRVIEALTARSEGLEEAEQWKTIESAPKDGTIILLWAPTLYERPVTGSWMINEGVWETEAGDVDDDGGPATDEDEIGSPEFWRPLPSPPVSQQKREG